MTTSDIYIYIYSICDDHKKKPFSRPEIYVIEMNFFAVSAEQRENMMNGMKTTEEEEKKQQQQHLIFIMWEDKQTHNIQSIIQ